MRDCDFEIISNKNIKLESYNQFYVFDSDRNVHNNCSKIIRNCTS